MPRTSLNRDLLLIQSLAGFAVAMAAGLSGISILSSRLMPSTVGAPRTATADTFDLQLLTGVGYLILSSTLLLLSGGVFAWIRRLPRTIDVYFAASAVELRALVGMSDSEREEFVKISIPQSDYLLRLFILFLVSLAILRWEYSLLTVWGTLFLFFGLNFRIIYRARALKLRYLATTQFASERGLTFESLNEPAYKILLLPKYYRKVLQELESSPF